MAYLVTNVDDDLIHATTHGIMSRDDLEFLRERVDQAQRSASGFVRKYLDVAKDSLARFDFGRLKDRVESMRDRFGRRWDEDRVLSIVDLSGAQNAKPTMRRYIMAMPRVRQLWYQDRLDGYSGLYEDDCPGAIGRDHDTYREVMNGSYVEGEEGEDTFVTYLGVVDDHGDSNLTHLQREAVRRTWNEISAMLDRGGQDPTSPLRKTL